MIVVPEIAQRFRDVALRHGDDEAIVAPDLRLTYGQLQKIIDCFVMRMTQSGVRQGQLVAIDTTDTVVAVASILALFEIGAQFVAFSIQIVRAPFINPDHYFRSRGQPGIEGIPTIEIDHTWSPKYADVADRSNDMAVGFSSASAPCWLMHSSGTTGEPKYMELSVSQVHDRILAVMEDFSPGHTRIACFFPCLSRPFTIRSIAALLSGCKLIDSDRADFLLANEANLVCAAPRQMSRWLGGAQLPSRIDRLQLSGARIDKSEVPRYLDSFVVVEDIYGSSETIKAYANLATRRGEKIDWRGAPHHATVEIVDEHGNSINEGILRLRSPYMIDGYLEAPEATARAFREGWFYPGDRARWGSKGCLEIIGRIDNVINLGGEKINLEAVDRVLSNAPGIETGVCFREFGEAEAFELAACVTVKKSVLVGDAVAAAHRACLERFGEIIAPKRIFVVEALPLTTDGVAIRNECRNAVLKALRNQSVGSRSSGAPWAAQLQTRN